MRKLEPQFTPIYPNLRLGLRFFSKKKTFFGKKSSIKPKSQLTVMLIVSLVYMFDMSKLVLEAAFILFFIFSNCCNNSGLFTLFSL